MTNSLQRWLERGCVALLAYIPFHAFISTWAYTNLGQELLIKSLKDGFVGLVAFMCLICALRLKPNFSKHEKLLAGAIFVFIFLHLILVFIGTEGDQFLAGLIINTRYLLFFASLFFLARVSKNGVNFQKKALKVVLVCFGITLIFGLAQAFVLRKDFLEFFGYGQADSISAYFTVDNDESTLRIFSTLRGPNPFGAYMVAVIPIAAIYLMALKSRRVAVGIAGGIFTAAVLFKTYSRAAALGAVSAIGAMLVLLKEKNIQRIVSFFCISVISLCAVVLAFYNTSFVQKIVFHTDPAETSSVDSDDKRVASLRSGISSIFEKPFGNGVGSAGIASYYGEKPRVIENFYLDTAYQLGLVGLAAILAIHLIVGKLLWERRKEPLAVALFAGFLGLFLINMLWPAWGDETLAYTWWGLAGLSLGVQKTPKRIKNAS